MLSKGKIPEGASFGELERAQYMNQHGLILAILIPCRDEAAAIAATVRGMRAALPQGTIYVYDNNSSDGTSVVAEEAGTIVHRESLQGKGHVVRRMFADVEADVYVLADGEIGRAFV